MSISSEIAAIIDLLNEAYSEADEAMAYLNDDDPLSSDVANIINNGYSQAEYARDNIGGAINDLEALDLPEDDEEDAEAPDQRPRICHTCGDRN